jgi:GPN-loop GTPase
MLHLMRVVDCATGCVFVPPPDSKVPSGAVDALGAPAVSRPNEFGLLSSAAGQIRGPRSDVREVQERWIDAKEEWDAFEKKE